jgi:hypothetical protein
MDANRLTDQQITLYWRSRMPANAMKIQVRRTANISGPSFLEDIRIDHGPARELGRFFLVADTLVRAAGIQLRLVSIKDASQAHTDNKESWPIFPPMLDSRLSEIPEDSSYALLGYNAAGEVVSSQAGRIYNSPRRSLSDIIGDQSFFYGQAALKVGHPTCNITAQAGEQIKGRFVYSGALWVRPDHRGSRLASLLPRISRSYALSRWGTDFTVTFLSNVNSQLLKHYGYPNVEKGVEVRGLATTGIIASLLWMDTDELADDLARFLEQVGPQIDGAVGNRSAEHQLTATAATDRNKRARVS